jgi:hypothetical protein
MATSPAPDLGDPRERDRILAAALRTGARARLGVGLGLAVLWVLAILGAMASLAHAVG